VIMRVNELTGIKESDTGLVAPALWDLAADKQTLQNEQPLQVCMKVVPLVSVWYDKCEQN
jgi:26S proteasome regulatory subunit T1